MYNAIYIYIYKYIYIYIHIMYKDFVVLVFILIGLMRCIMKLSSLRI